jgi:signal transduction histidine kinase
MRGMSEEAADRTALGWKNLGLGLANGNSCRILVVDDNEAIRYTLVRSLREAGFHVLEARNGDEALAFAKESPDLITLDVNLPDIHGFELCKQLKSNPSTSHIPILHLSSTFIDPESRVHGLASGADAYLAEPIDRAELVATIGALLRLKNAETQARQQAHIAEEARRELAQLNAALEIRVRERTTELQTANQSLRELSGYLLRMQDDERRRIARELHDSVGQMLAAVKMNNAILRNRIALLESGAAEALSENDKLVEEVLQSIRTISYLLHPPLLDEAGLPSALRDYVEEFSRRSGVDVALHCESTIARMPSEVETAFFRITQECLSNVHRHSESKSATVRLYEAEGWIHLDISDKGRGISPDKRNLMDSGGGVGLRGMRERVALLGGKFSIESTEGGTTVSATLPRTHGVQEAVA